MNLEDIEVRANEAYPDIENYSKDIMTVGIIKNLATSRFGELKGILQYVYQSTIADKINQEIARILQEISIVEMIHLDLLMHAEMLFGGDAKYDDAQGNIFNTNFINYTPKLKDMLEYNILAEQKSIDAYKEAISRVKNESLKQLFNRIIEDEKKHIFAFEQIRNNVEFLSI